MKRRGWNDGAASDVIGTVLIVGITVLAGSGLTYAVSRLSPPDSGPAATIEALLLPSNPDAIVFEHRGGAGIDASALRITTIVDGVATTYDLRERLLAGDSRFSIVASDGTTRGPTSQVLPGDQVRFEDSALLGRAVEAILFDSVAGRVLVGPVRMASADTTPPRLLSGAKTSATTVLLTFSEPLDRILPADFTISSGSISAAQLVGNGTSAELTTTSLGPSATPTITVIAAPLGTADLALLALVGGTAVVARDSTPPTISAGPIVATECPELADVEWTTDEPSTSVVEYGPTTTLGITATDSTLVTSHGLTFAGVGAGQLYHYRVKSTDALGNTATSAVGTFTMPTTVFCVSGPGFGNSVYVNIIYVSQQTDGIAANIGLNILNPTNDDVEVDWVEFSVNHTLGAGAANAFFRTALTTGPGSDSGFACIWTGVNTNIVRCDPAGTVTVPGGGHRQLVLGFTTSGSGSTGHGLITATASVTSPAPTTYTNTWNFRHDSPASTHHFPLFGLTAAGGSKTAGFGSITGGTVNSFCFEWTRLSGPAGTVRTHTTFIVPPGWADLTVPIGQAALNSVIVGVKQPTGTRAGYMEVYSSSAGTIQLCWQARAPSTYSLNLIEVQYEGDTLDLASQLTFGVKVSS